MSTIAIFFLLLIIILCVILTLIILSQNPKGGGLSSTFGGGGSQMFGVQRTNEFMDKATWTVSGTIVAVIIIASVLMIPKSSIEKQPEKANQTEQNAPQKPANNAENK